RSTRYPLLVTGRCVVLPPLTTHHSPPSEGELPVAEDANKPDPFDVQTVKALVALMSRHDLSEIDLRDGPLRIRIRRGPPGGVMTAPAPVVVPAVSAPVPAAVPAAAPPPAPKAPDKPAKALHEIKSETPGTFYAAPNPGAEPFVRVGSRVTPTTIVCIIE